MGLGDFGGDLASILQNLPIGRGDEAIEAGFPVLHSHGNLPQRHGFSHIEVGGNEALQLLHFAFRQVVFRHADIELLDLALGRVFPGGETHVIFVGIGAGDDYLRRRLAVDGPMELVLHRGEEALGGGGGDIVINGSRVDVGDFLVKFALAQADFANALELFLEVFFAEYGAVVFQALVIHRVALDGERLDDAGSPFAELNGAFRVHLVTDRDNGGEVVVLGAVGFAIRGSYSKISNN